MQIAGRVVKKLFGKGSKSEREAIWLETDSDRYILRRAGGNPFHDPELERLVGKTIVGTGTVTGYTFLLSDWNET